MESWFSPQPRTAVAGLVLCAAGACGEAKEASKLELPVQVDGSCIVPVTTDLGYQVSVSTLRLAARDLQFAVAGEVHAARSGRPLGWLLPTARAHPGHYTGGEITGELPGRFVLDWVHGDGAPLGTATLLEGLYDSANLTLDHADPGDMQSQDALRGHSALIEGTAERAGALVPFRAQIDSPDGRQIVGVPFDLRIDAHTDGTLGLALCTVDPLEQDTLFDGLDFAALTPAEEGDAPGTVLLSERSMGANLDAYQQLKRTLQTHDHFVVRPVE